MRNYVEELVPLVADLVHRSPADLLAEVRRIASDLKVRPVRASGSLTTRDRVAAVAALYGGPQAHPWRQYTVKCNGQSIDTSMYVLPTALQWNIPLSVEAWEFVESPPTLADDATSPRAARRLLPAYLAGAMNSETRIWDQPTFRLINYPEAKGDAFQFTKTQFVNYLASGGMLSPELDAAIMACGGDTNALLLRRAELLPLRQQMLPSARSLRETRDRVCVGGPGVLMAFARRSGFRGDPDFLIPIQVRSGTVADNTGLYTVIPHAYHQPVTRDPAELCLRMTVLREVFEELYGGEELQKTADYLLWNWYLGEFPGVRRLADDRYFRTELVSHGFNVISGNHDMAVVGIVEDLDYLDDFGAQMKKMWETQTITHVSSVDADGIAEHITSGRWAPHSLFHFVEGLRRLRELFPNRVRLPVIEVIL